MNSKERVSAALTRANLPDRVPLQFDLSKRLLERYSQKYNIPLHYTHAYYEDVTYRLSGNEIRIAMGSDCITVGGSLPKGYQHQMDEQGNTINEFGMKMRQGDLYMDLVGHPLARVESLGEIEDYPFPDPLAEGRFDDAKAYIDRYKGKYFIWGDIELTMFAMARNLVGMEKWLVDMALGKPYVEALIDKCLSFASAVGKQLVRLGVDGILGGDDYGAQNGMLISPKMWRRYFKDRYKLLHKELKALNPDLIIAHHCDGAVSPILGDWIEAGLEVFNPVQPNVPGHEPEELKNTFGDQLSFWGAIDEQQLLPFGSPKDIKTEVTRIATILGEGGGYLAAPAHIIQADTPEENIQAFIDTVRAVDIYK
jgi:uroporphyrinogen decarboxylase